MTACTRWPAWRGTRFASGSILPEQACACSSMAPHQPAKDAGVKLDGCEPISPALLPKVLRRAVLLIARRLTGSISPWSSGIAVCVKRGSMCAVCMTFGSLWLRGHCQRSMCSSQDNIIDILMTPCSASAPRIREGLSSSTSESQGKQYRAYLQH